MERNRHSIWVNAPIQEAVSEIILWGEASWWPKKSAMRFIRYQKGPVQEGTRYRQEVLLPFAPSWDVEVSDLTDRSISRRFLNGMFEGQETVSLDERPQGLEVVYQMDYRVCGPANRILWNLVFRRMHDANIERILGSLKRYLEDKVNNS